MKKTTKIKLWLNPKTGKFGKKEYKNQPYIEAFQETEVKTKQVAFFDLSGSQTPKNIEHYYEKAKEMGLTEYYFFNDILHGPFKLEDFSLHELKSQIKGYGFIDFLKDLPIEIEPLLFTDGEGLRFGDRSNAKPYMAYIFNSKINLSVY